MLLLAQGLWAVDVYWEDTGTSFSTDGNWVGGTAPSGSTDVAVFDADYVSSNNVGTIDFQPTFDTSIALGGIRFNQGGWTISDGGSQIVYLDSNGVDSTLYNVGNNTIDVEVRLNDSQSWHFDSGTLTMSNFHDFYGRTMSISGAGDVDFSGTATIGTGTNSASTELQSSGTGDVIVSGTLNAGGSTNTLIWDSTGSGKLILSGDINTRVEVEQGTVQLASNTALDGGLRLDGGTIEASAARTFTTDITFLDSSTIGGSNDITWTAGTMTATGWDTLTVNNTGTTTLNNIVIGNGGAEDITLAGTGALVVAGAISVPDANGHDITISNTNKVTFQGNNSYDGTTTVNSGSTLNIQHANALGATGSGTTVSSGGTLELQGGITVASAENLSIRGTGVSSGGALRNISGNNTYGGALTLNAATRINSDANTLTLSGTISGSQALTVGGSGNVTVSGTSSSLTSITKDGSGALTLGGNDRFNTSANLTVDAGTFDLNGNSQTIAGFDLNGGTVSLGAGTLTTSGSTAGDITGTITGTGTFAKTGSSTLTLGSSDRIADTVSVNMQSGVLNLGGNTEAINNLSFSGGTIDFGTTGGDNHFLFDDVVSVSGVINISSNWETTSDNWVGTGDILGIATNSATIADYLDSINFASSAYQGAQLYNDGVTTRTIGGTTYYIIVPLSTNVWDGDTDTSWSDATNWQGDAYVANDVIIFNDTATGLATDAFVDSNQSIAGIDFQNSSNAVTIEVSTGNTLTIDSAGILLTTGSGNATINGAGTGNVALGANQTWEVATGRTLEVGANLNIGANTLTLDVVDSGLNILTISGVISGSGNLENVGAGDTTLSGANTYTGTTTITDGRIIIEHATALGSSAAGTVVADGTTLTLNHATGFTVAGEALTVSGLGDSNAGALRATSTGSYTWTGDITVGANDTRFLVNTDATLTISGDVSGSSVVKKGLGALHLEGNFSSELFFDDGSLYLNNSSGSALTASTFTLGNIYTASTDLVQLLRSEQIGDTTAVTMVADADSPSTLDLNDFDERIGSLAATSTNNTVDLGSGTLYTGGNNTSTSYAGVITGSGGSLVKEGSGTFTITNTGNDYTGTTQVDAGTLQLGAAGVVSDSSALVVNGGTFDLNNFNETVASLAGSGGTVDLGTATLTFGGSNANTSYAGSITGTGGLVKTGSGTTTLTGAAGHSGTTTINSGTLQLDGTLASTSGVTVSSGGTLLLGAANRINDSASITLSGGKLDTGGFSETVGALTLTANSIIDMGSGASILTFTGTVTGLNSFTLEIYNWTGEIWVGNGTDQLIFDDVLTLAEMNNIIFYTDAGVTLASSTGGWGFHQTGSNEVVPIPEPSTYGVGVLLLLILGRYEWKRRKAKAKHSSTLQAGAACAVNGSEGL